jgi:hypothetical protein
MSARKILASTEAPVMTKSTRSHAHARLGSQAFDARRILMIVSHRPVEMVEFVTMQLLDSHALVRQVLLVRFKI